MRSFKFAAAVCALVASLLSARAALAHPHILATARVEIMFAGNGKVEGLRHTWAYDPAYSSFAVRKADADGDGHSSPPELAGFAKTHLTELRGYAYFTTVTQGGVGVEFDDAVSERLVQTGTGLLELSFTLPFKKPVVIDKPLTIELYDPNFFAYFTLADGTSLQDDAGVPEKCATEVSGPKPIDLSHTRSIPSAFWAALDGSSEAGRQFVNRITVTCPFIRQISHR